MLSNSKDRLCYGQRSRVIMLITFIHHRWTHTDSTLHWFMTFGQTILKIPLIQVDEILRQKKQTMKCIMTTDLKQFHSPMCCFQSYSCFQSFLFSLFFYFWFLSAWNVSSDTKSLKRYFCSLNTCASLIYQ